MKYLKKFEDFLFIIPARSGSKGIKNKNIKKIKNKFLIEYTFNILKNIKSEKKYLITDSKKIKKIANKYKINSEYFRNKKLSGDKTEIIKNIIHFNKFIKKKKIDFKYFVILQPTSPLRTFLDLKKAIQKFLKENLDSLFSISKSQEHPNETIFFKNKKIQNFVKEKKKMRQFYKESYFINGAIYIFKKEKLKKKNIFYGKKTGVLIMKKINSLDLDDYQDLEIVNKLI